RRRPRPCPARPWPCRPTSPTPRPRDGWPRRPSTASAACTCWSPTPAGPPPARALEVDDQALQAALQANLLSSIRLVQAALPQMRAAGWGRICLITSKAVKEPIPTLALSNTARTGLWAWAKTAAADLFDEGITLNLACPGTHDTDRARQAGMVGDGPVGDPADFGKVVCFLCSAPARFVSGTALQVDGATTRGLL
ncbi:MAG TPA: SDR family oxidoreductase, partial [Actinomycetota bacterium]|nr:SDR family oxidoreductase [Actinomycetota bacterium]